MIDPRSRPAVYGSVFVGLAIGLTLWFLGVPPVLAWMTGWSVPAFVVYVIDKRQARAGRWRVPEALFHGLALVGGVVGSWAGRAVVRHKTQRPVFLAVLVAATILWASVAIWALRR
jgi:uncharacterized membrane protein YsdA (DUF1294 family)